MGFWDDLWGRIQQTTDAAKEEATKRAASAAVDRLKRQVESAADEALSSAEKELEEAQRAREGRPEYRPSADASDADSIIASSEAMLAARRRGEPAAAPSSTYAEQRQARQDRARAELEALKAKLKAGGALDADGDGVPDGPDDQPVKRTL
jgi:arginine utilization protein RocB